MDLHHSDEFVLELDYKNGEEYGRGEVRKMEMWNWMFSMCLKMKQTDDRITSRL